MINKELINISIKILNKNNKYNIEHTDVKNGVKIDKLDYNEGIKFVFDLVLQLEKLFDKGYVLKNNKLDKKDIVKIKNNYLLVNYDNFTKKNNQSKKQIYYIVSEICIELMKLNSLDDIQSTKLYYMLKRMMILDNENEYFFV
jgi:hypothetical protein